MQLEKVGPTFSSCKLYRVFEKNGHLKLVIVRSVPWKIHLISCYWCDKGIILCMKKKVISYANDSREIAVQGTSEDFMHQILGI